MKDVNLKMKRIAAFLMTQLVWMSQAASTKTYDEAHDTCLRAIDYLNCISIQLNVESKTQKLDSTPTKNAPYRSEGEACFSQDGVEYCIAKKGKDIFGLPKPAGWVYRINDNGSISYDMTPPRKVNVRGSTNRYFEIKNILRYYSQGRAGTASRQITLGSQSTNCTGNIFGQTSSYSIDCTTSPATTSRSKKVDTQTTNPNPSSKTILASHTTKTQKLTIDAIIPGNNRRHP